VSSPSSSLVWDEEACLALNGHCEKGVAAAAQPSNSTGGRITHGELSSAVVLSRKSSKSLEKTL
jgi:hypothetical protein